MSLPIIMLVIGLIGSTLNNRNIILLFISLELILLSITLIILNCSQYFDDSFGLFYGIVILIIAGAESAIGLALLVTYFKIKGTVEINL